MHFIRVLAVFHLCCGLFPFSKIVSQLFKLYVIFLLGPAVPRLEPMRSSRHPDQAVVILPGSRICRYHHCTADWHRMYLRRPTMNPRCDASHAPENPRPRDTESPLLPPRHWSSGFPGAERTKVNGMNGTSESRFLTQELAVSTGMKVTGAMGREHEQEHRHRLLCDPPSISPCHDSGTVRFTSKAEAHGATTGMRHECHANTWLEHLRLFHRSPFLIR